MPDTLPASLYEADYFAWTQRQAALLRGQSGRGAALDWDNLAEEIEDIGRSQERACESMVRNILLRFLKLRFAAAREPVRHWRRGNLSGTGGARSPISGSISSANFRRACGFACRRRWMCFTPAP
ncbi:MAG: DUF29 domain-containing protein [Alphaproteobacteria bacterium]|nr:DUF29 domain-containing protein [Alphaproteobacteria bacterium]